MFFCFFSIFLSCPVFFVFFLVVPCRLDHERSRALHPLLSSAVLRLVQEVKEHLRSLPERYSLTVSPEDVLDHMSLFAEVTAAAAAAAKPAETATRKHASSSASTQDEPLSAAPPTVRVVARPSPLPSLSSYPAAAGGREGGMSCRSGLLGGGSGGGGGNCGSSGGGGGGRAYSLTVACRQSPLLLGAISSSLRSAGGRYAGVSE